MLLGILKQYWSKYKREVTPSITTELSETKVLCEKGGIEQIIFASAVAEGNCSEILAINGGFSFLKLRDSLQEESEPAWRFLEGFGVGKSADLQFYLRILDCIVGSKPNAGDLSDPERLFQLYGLVQSNCVNAQDQEIVRNHFRNKPSIYFISESGVASWVYPDQCLWKAPSDMISRRPLMALCQRCRYFNSHAREGILTDFFQTTLQISDVNSPRLLTELMEIRESIKSNIERLDRAQNVYRLFYHMTKDDAADLTKVRNCFKIWSLIYVPGTAATWYTSPSCVWSSAGEITGKVNISEIYPDLEDFFLSSLKIEVTNLNMLMDEFVALDERHASIEAFKVNIWNFNSLLLDDESPPTPERLLNLSILPILLSNRTIRLRKPTSHFAIIDRQKLGKLFSGEANLLDFTLQEVRKLHPFLHWLHVEDRYLSNAVKEISTFGGGSERAISAPHCDVRSKAGALFRCAVHYDSPRASVDDQAFYKTLLRTTVYESDDISSSLVLSQNGRSITVEIEKSLFAMKETGGRLDIYVPRDQRLQELAIIGKLPEGLLEHMMTDPDTGIATDAGTDAIKVIGRVLQASLSIVDDVLEQEGIVPHEISLDRFSPDTQRPGSEIPDTTSSVTEDISRSSSQVIPVSARQGSATPSASTSWESSPELRTSLLNSSPIWQPTFINVQQPSPRPEIDSQQGYKRLLKWVVDVSSSALFPTRSLSSKNLRLARQSDYPGQAALSGAFGDRLLNQGEHDKMIGAAGELFTFELLKRRSAHLPGFDLASWRSSIRKYARAHEDYADMEPWHGPETTDLVYLDFSGSFTRHLVNLGYLQGVHWENATPQYFFEVKTTINDCNTPFFASNSQYNRMKNTTEYGGNGRGPNTNAVYIIFRVYNLDKENLDLKVYVDPHKLEREGLLRFQTDKWTVTPGRS